MLQGGIDTVLRPNASPSRAAMWAAGMRIGKGSIGSEICPHLHVALSSTLGLDDGVVCRLRRASAARPSGARGRACGGWGGRERYAV